MGRTSSNTQYGTIAVTLHWLSAILIFILLGSGFIASDTENSITKIMFLRFHVPIAIMILLLTIARICWWLFADKKPTPVAMPAWQMRLSRVTHLLLYFVIIVMSASGIGMMVLSGAGPIIFGGDAATLPDFWNYPPRLPHAIIARVFVVLLILHVGAALYHHFVKQDGLLRRMWFG
ncbi:MAG: cytochrome b/b6 domain-containing protein [Alphaproteobacteria bacterium]|nr:cytochrome b/b6 domain-containing protein [Alphaproteobacteria bacterium]